MRLAFVILLALAATASAQERITPSDLDAPTWGPRAGKTVALDAKFDDYFAGELRVVGVARGKLALDLSTAKGDALGGELAGLFRRRGERLEKGRSNVRVTGVARDDALRGRAL